MEWDIQQIISENVDPEKVIYWTTYALAGYGPLLMLLVTSHDIQTALEKAYSIKNLRIYLVL